MENNFKDRYAVNFSNVENGKNDFPKDYDYLMGVVLRSQIIGQTIEIRGAVHWPVIGHETSEITKLIEDFSDPEEGQEEALKIILEQNEKLQKRLKSSIDKLSSHIGKLAAQSLKIRTMLDKVDKYGGWPVHFCEKCLIIMDYHGGTSGDYLINGQYQAVDTDGWFSCPKCKNHIQED